MTMDNSISLRRVFCFICTLSFVYGENVMVHILKQTSYRPQSCSHPTNLDVTILRQHINDVTLSLRVNRRITVPSHVVLMGTDPDDASNAGTISYRHMQVPKTSQAYHSVSNAASFVIRCAHHKPTNTPYFILEGTFFHEETKFTLRATNDDVIVGPIDVTAPYVMEEVEEYNNPEDHDFIEPDWNQGAPQPSPDAQARQSGHNSRSKRQTTEYYIDVLPVIDFHLYKKWSLLNDNDLGKTTEAITTYMTNVFTAMSLRVSTLTLRNNKVINLRMLTPHLSTSASTSAFSEDNKEPAGNGEYRINVKTQLDAFKEWLVGDANLPETDHTMLFTGIPCLVAGSNGEYRINVKTQLDAFKGWLVADANLPETYHTIYYHTGYTVYGGLDGEVGNNLTRGLAFVSGICQTDGFSSSVVQDQMAYQSEPVAVHELGHSLGSKHDGEDNACSSYDRYIMSNGTYVAHDDDTFNAFRFSSCSSDQVSTKFEELEATSFLASCLEKEIGIALSVYAPLDAKDQCQNMFGAESYVCRGDTFLSSISDLCTSLYCYLPGQGVCRWLLPATGTCCGKGKYCVEGRCIATPSGECGVDETCPLEDVPGIIFTDSDQTCNTMHSANCYLGAVYDKCCRTCQKFKTVINGCLFGDKIANCKQSLCGATMETGFKYDFYCCKTCEHLTCHDQPGIVFQGGKYTCPQFVDKFGRHLCHFREIHDENCCHTCEEHRSSGDVCPYGDRLHEYNCGAIAPLNRFCNSKEMTLCCETCPTITIVPKTTPTNPNPDPDGDTDSTKTPDGSTDGTPADSTEGCVGAMCGSADSLAPSGRWSLLAATLIVFVSVHYVILRPDVNNEAIIV